MRGRDVIGIRDVAREAGVSVTTVSHALSGKGRIHEATRRRVREAAERLGYVPNASASSLATGRTGVIALAFSLTTTTPIGNVDWFSRAIQAATARALQHDYALIIGPPTFQGDVWRRVPLDGIVVFDPLPGDPVLARARSLGTPFVLAGRDLHGAKDDYVVDNDHARATRMVLDHLRERGARRIALLAGALGDAFTHDTVRSYRAWCRRHGLEPRLELVPRPLSQEVRPAVERLLVAQDRPDGIYANVEVLGIAAIHAAETHAIRVPNELRVVVCSDRQIFEDVSLPPTTLELDPERTAIEAIDLLVEQIEGRPPSERRRRIPTRLVPRAST